MTDDDEELTAVDRDALERALALARREAKGGASRSCAWCEDGWFKAAHFAAYSRQIDALGLKPWQSPPVYGDIPGDTAAAALLQRLLDAGLSRYEPSPIEALRALEARPPVEPPTAA